MQENGKIVLSVGEHSELLSLREAVLRSAGFDVFTTHDKKVALNRIKEGHCGVLLMCYSLPDGWREQLVKTFRQHCPQGKVVAISNKAIEKVPLADEVIYGIEGPEALIDALRQ